ncbi:YqiJ family protein [Candidatus Magnetomoraceae bacterium gMMP-15]
MEFITADQNLCFTIAIAVMLGIALLEGITTILGFGLSTLIEQFVPDIDFDMDIDLDHVGGLSRFYAWFNVGRVPVFILFIILITSFGLIGLSIQFILYKSFMLMPGWVVSIPSIILAFLFVKLMGKFLGNLIPKDETSAVSENSFIGKLAVITLGRAKKNYPAQAKLKDEHGKTHYIMVEPDNDDEIFETGTKVIIIDRKGMTYTASKNTDPYLDEYEF